MKKDRLIDLGVRCLTINHEVTDLIPGTSTILNVGQVWNGVHLAS